MKQLNTFVACLLLGMAAFLISCQKTQNASAEQLASLYGEDEAAVSDPAAADAGGNLETSSSASSGEAGGSGNRFGYGGSDTEAPVQPLYRDNTSYGGLLRAADFIGQLGDPNYLRKVPALYYEFEENGVNKQIGYQSPGHMRRNFTKFYFNVVVPYIDEAVKFMNITQDGKQWIANLYAHVHHVEHNLLHDTALPQA